MLDILLVVQIVISLLLITVILLQRTGADSLSGLSGGGTTGVVSAKTAANFLSTTTIILATLFMLNSLILANLSSRPKDGAMKKIEQEVQKEVEKESTSAPEVK